MKTKDFANYLVDHYGPLMKRHLQERNNLKREDLEYVAEKAATLRDDRLQACIGTLIGWGDEERAEIETFIAISLEVIRRTPPSRLREAARVVDLRSYQ